MEKQTKGLTKKSIYFILLGIAVLAVIVAVTIAIAKNAKRDQLDAPKSVSQSVSKSNSQSTTPSKTNSKSDAPKSSEPAKQTDAEIIFTMPVTGGNVITEYTAASVVYNKTLGMYTGHMGIDIAGSEGAKVFAAYDGVVADVTTSYLEGTTITINHGENLQTIYNSIEPLETIAVGMTIKAGDELGIISTNNRQEYKDGAHLHFEVLESGKNVDPYKYLAVNAK